VTIRYAILLLVALAACSIQPDLEPPPNCSLPMADGGPRCSCPGTSIQAFDCAEVFMCRQDGTWAPYDASCLTMSSEAGSIPSDAGVADATGEPREQ
jgi:hypothetical protein